MYIRNCPKCNKELTYKHKSNLNRAIRNSVICRNCSQLDQKNDDAYLERNEKISKAEYGMLLRERNDLKSQLIRESESNKNYCFHQQLEIDSLKYQNKCIQDKLNIANNTVALQIEENTKLNEKISNMDRIIKSLSDEITQKDGVIAYLENKLELNK